MIRVVRWMLEFPIQAGTIQNHCSGLNSHCFAALNALIHPCSRERSNIVPELIDLKTTARKTPTSAAPANAKDPDSS
eukprot:1438366-Pyramimonas_sp.AAC.1